MATASIAGYKAFVSLSTASGQAKVRVVELRDYTVSPEHAEIDATSHDSSGDSEIIAGTGSWTMTADILHVMSSGEAGSANAVFDALVTRVLVDIEFVPTGSTNDGTYSGSGRLTGFELGAPNDDALNTSFSLRGTGALTRNSSA